MHDNCNKFVNQFKLIFLSHSLSDLAAIRKILENETGGALCPSCQMPFDKGKKRKLIDNCGHERCYSCLFKNEACPICSMETSHRHENGKCNLI